MLLKLICLVAIISTALCLFLWFRDVRRIMKEQRSTVIIITGHCISCGFICLQP